MFIVYTRESLFVKRESRPIQDEPEMVNIDTYFPGDLIRSVPEVFFFFNNYLLTVVFFYANLLTKVVFCDRLLTVVFLCAMIRLIRKVR